MSAADASDAGQNAASTTPLATTHAGGNSEQEASRPPSPAMAESILKLATSRAIIIGVNFACAPILGRLYLPHAFGVSGVLATIISILAGFSSLTYVFAIPLARSSSERRDLFVLCALLSVPATAILAIAVLAGGGRWLARTFHEPDVAEYAYFLPLMFFVAGARQLLDTTLACRRRYGAVAIRAVLDVTVTDTVQIGANFLGQRGSPAALVTGNIAGNAVAALAFSVSSVREVFHQAEEPLRARLLRAAAARHRKFPSVQLWSVTLNAVTLGLPALVLGMRFSVETVGLYGMATTMIGLPMQLFVTGATQVFYVEAGERVSHGEPPAPVVEQLVRVLSLLTPFPLAAVALLGPLVFEIVLGPEWYAAGVFAQILFPWMALAAFFSPLSSAWSIFARQGEGFSWNIVLLVARFSALFFGGLFFGVWTTLALFVAVSVVILGWLIYRTLSLFGVSRRWAGGVIARTYAEAFVLLLPSAVLYWWLRAPSAALVAMAVATVTYGFVLYRRHPEVVKPLLSRFFPRRATPEGVN